MIYTLDTNVFVDALRQPSELEHLKTFLNWALPSTVLSSIVAAELTAGARTGEARRVLDHVFLEAFERRGRIVAPSAAAWRRAGALLTRVETAGLGASRQNDALLAVQARERGWMVVTRDRDFQTLRTLVSGLRVAAPFPERPE
ncbi:MAG: type II toxin-antitoxin system VapC family toxin [Gemmatimonadaceae bacterium]|nr:type II toxin-antitoxin system VapC family toxin [Gemmatimonadaceae bacterium]